MNSMVVWYPLYFVESRIYKKVEAVFLVCSHTENVCDRLFKQVKRGFHHKNVYTTGQLINACSIYDTVTPVLCTRMDFFNCDKHLEMLYERRGSGTFKLNHIFVVIHKRS